MVLLALDTSLAACSVALWRDGEVRAERFVAMARGHAEALVPMVLEVCRDAGIAVRDVEAFAVTRGPGTFAGIRVGLATARGLALPTARPVVGVSTLAAIAATAGLPNGPPILVVQDARRGEVYAERIGGTGPRLCTLTGLPAAYPERPLRLVGSAAAQAAAVLGMGAVIATDEVLPRAAALAGLAARCLAAQGAAAFRVPPAPLYLRAPDAKLPVRS